MAAKRKASALAPLDEEPVDPSDELLFLCLGGGNEVGRSCHIIQYKGKTVMLDAGMHPAHEGMAAMPFFDNFDLSTVDVLLISHFHIDHAASLPYVLAKTDFRGQVFMTHSTKAIYKWLIQDAVRVGNTASSSEQRTQMYTEADHLSTFPQITAIDYHTTHTVSSIRITPYPAGHVLGAAMYLVSIAGINILFTGDYSREKDRHLIPAEVPKGIKIDVLITESTYGVSSHVPRLEREAALMKSITGILNRGGRALLPVFALGRAQELLLILDEYWGKHPEYQNIPIYYASNLARKCMVIYQTYIGAMNDNIKRLFRERLAEAEASGSLADSNRGGPWDFRFIRSLKSLDRFDDVGGCVMLASPGMMQNGVSRELLERWAPDQRNGVVITGYSVEGTMAKEILKEPEQIAAITSRAGAAVTGRKTTATSPDGEKVMIPRRCSIDEYSFAAHVDGQENMEFIEETASPVVILVHGEKSLMTRLKSRLLSLNNNKTASQKTKVFSPANCEELRIPIRTEKIAKVVGKLAEQFHIPQRLKQDTKADESTDNGDALETAQEDQLITGVLVQNDFKLSLMTPDDLREYAGLTTTTVTCRQKLTLAAAGIELIRWALEGTFGGIQDLTSKDTPAKAHTNGTNGTNSDMKKEPGDDADEEIDRTETRFLVMDTVTVIYRTGGEIEVEWEGNMVNDGIADAVLAVLYSVESSPAAVKHSSKQHSHHPHTNGTTTPPTKPSTPPSRHNPHAAPSPQARLDRLFMFLEAQFGAANVSPITTPKPPPPPPGSTTSPATDTPSDPDPAAELARLAALHIPVPGIAIRVDKHEARVWLETLAVECASSSVLRERVRAVVERAVEIVSPLWVGKGAGAGGGGAAATAGGGGGGGGAEVKGAAGE